MSVSIYIATYNFESPISLNQISKQAVEGNDF